MVDVDFGACVTFFEKKREYHLQDKKISIGLFSDPCIERAKMLVDKK